MMKVMSTGVRGHHNWCSSKNKMCSKAGGGCPRSFRSASVARFGRETEIGCGDSEPVPASLARSCPRSFRSASVARFGQDDGKDWMRRLGTGTGEAVLSTMVKQKG